MPPSPNGPTNTFKLRGGTKVVPPQLMESKSNTVFRLGIRSSRVREPQDLTGQDVVLQETWNTQTKRDDEIDWIDANLDQGPGPAD